MRNCPYFNVSASNTPACSTRVINNKRSDAPDNSETGAEKYDTFVFKMESPDDENTGRPAPDKRGFLPVSLLTLWDKIGKRFR